MGNYSGICKTNKDYDYVEGDLLIINTTLIDHHGDLQLPVYLTWPAGIPCHKQLPKRYRRPHSHWSYKWKWIEQNKNKECRECICLRWVSSSMFQIKWKWTSLMTLVNWMVWNHTVLDGCFYDLQYISRTPGFAAGYFFTAPSTADLHGDPFKVLLLSFHHQRCQFASGKRSPL